MTLKPASLLALCVLVGCGADTRPVAGGGGFGGETVSGMVVGVSGRGIPGAALRLRDGGSSHEAVLRETTTDSTGRFRLETPSGLALRLEVAGWDGADTVRALLDVEPGQSPGRILAEVPTPRRVRLVDEAGRPVPASLRAYGLGRVAATDDSGIADIGDWPAADLWVEATTKDGLPHDLFVPREGGRVVVGRGWLVDDFEGPSNRTRLGILAGGGWWYVAAVGTTDRKVPDIAAMRDSTDFRSGKASLHPRFDFIDTATRYGLVGFHFGAVETDLVDLSGLDSLVFHARGTGTVRVEFVADIGGGVTSHAVQIALDSAWTRHVVPASALAPIVSGRSWSVDSKRVRFLQFIVFQNADFRLDDIHYHGRKRP